MKKFVKRVAAAVLAVTVLGIGGVVSAEEAAPRPQKVSVVGLIEKVKIMDFLFGTRQSAEITLQKEDGTRLKLNAGRNTVIVDQNSYESLKVKDLTDGVLIFAGFNLNEPNIAEKTTVAAEVIVMLGEQAKSKIKYDVFNENGYSSDGAVRIVLTEQTEITDEKGRAVEAEAAVNKPMLVFFDKLEEKQANEIPAVIPSRVIVVE